MFNWFDCTVKWELQGEGRGGVRTPDYSKYIIVITVPFGENDLHWWMNFRMRSLWENLPPRDTRIDTKPYWPSDNNSSPFLLKCVRKNAKQESMRTWLWVWLWVRRASVERQCREPHAYSVLACVFGVLPRGFSRKRETARSLGQGWQPVRHSHNRKR